MLKLLLLLPGLLLVAVAGLLVLRPDAQSADLRAAEQLWAAGRSSEALRQFTALEMRGNKSPLIDVRLAALRLLRGECPEAQTRAATALLHAADAGLRRDEAALAHLIAGQCAALDDNAARREAEWASVDPRSPLRPLADLLRGEAALRSGAEADALKHYTAALDRSLPEPWRALAHFRSALALASLDPAAASAHLAAIPATLPPPAPETRPFLPMPPAEIVAQSRQLAAILTEAPEKRGQLLGQQLLALDLFRSAIVRFEQTPINTPGGPLAQAQAAYARWQIGQTTAATAQLRELAAAYPQEPVIATLYATVALHTGALDDAEAALNAAEVTHPLDPALALVRADIYAARHDYPHAIAELKRARDIARPEARGRYAITLAEEHLRLTYRPCDAGIDAAHDATALAPDDPAAWQVLAATLYHCRDYAEAAAAARSGLEIAPEDAALEFFLGAALWSGGDKAEGRAHLLNAADRAPASEWRSRAEELLGSQATGTD